MILERFLPRDLTTETKRTGPRYFDPAFGIFGKLTCDDGDKFFAYTLEHAYASMIPGESFKAKLPEGEYTCERGFHKIGKPGELKTIETFEVKNVPGHSGILFHVGNSNRDSDGCILLGTEILMYGLSESRKAFEQFMLDLKGINQFQLRVRSTS